MMSMKSPSSLAVPQGEGLKRDGEGDSSAGKGLAVMRSLTANPALSAPPLQILEFQALGTRCKVLYAAPGQDRDFGFENETRNWVEAFEARYSRYRPESLLSKVNEAAGGPWLDIDAEMEQMLRLCGTLWSMTGGLLDATALPLMRLWDYTRRHERLPSKQEINVAQNLVGWPKVELAPGRVRLPQVGMALDFGGFGKEWAVDVVAEIARQHGLAALVVFGHDVRAVGQPPGRPAWHVGLEDPLKPGSAEGSIAVPAGKGVASSGDYLRHFEFQGRRYGHIIDPRKGRPVANDCLQVTVVADSCLLAGMLSTAAFVLGPSEGISLIQSVPRAEGLIVGAQIRAQTRAFWQYAVT